MIDFTEHKGDFLLFGNLAKVVCPDEMSSTHKFLLGECEIEPGKYERYPKLPVAESRSDISRDGYLGVLFDIAHALHQYPGQFGTGLNKEIKLNEIIKYGWKNKWKFGDRGTFDYTNMSPLIPLIYAVKTKSKFWVPVPPVWALKLGKSTTGFRAHYFALYALIAIMSGTKPSKFRFMFSEFTKQNPDNVWFERLYEKSWGLTSLGYYSTLPRGEKAGSGWGSCPNEVLNGLAKYTSELDNLLGD